MKKLICILTAVMLVFAVSCSNDTPSVDSSTPVINAPEFNTDYSELNDSDKLNTIVYPLLDIVNNADTIGADPITEAVIEEAEANIMAGSQKGSVSKSNSNGTITVVATYDMSVQETSLGIYYIGYDYEDYTIWGFWEYDREYTLRNNITGDITKVREEYPDEGMPIYYLNDVHVEY